MCCESLRMTPSAFSKLWHQSLLLLLAGLLACEGSSSGQLDVDTGEVTSAVSYRVEVYARNPGQGLVEGVSVTDSTTASVKRVPEGDWVVLVMARDGDRNAIAHFRANVSLQEGETIQVPAGIYRPGSPGDPIPESDTTLAAFGPNGDALLSAIYGPDDNGLPNAAVEVSISNGSSAQVAPRVSPRSGLAAPDFVPRCATCFLPPAPDEVPTRDAVRARFGNVTTGSTTDFFIVTTSQTATCQRILNDAQTQNCLIFAEVVNGQPVLSDATALAIAQGFDSDNPFQANDTGIYAETRARYGSEWKTNPVGGRDADERVVLVFLSSTSIGGSGLFGFFRPQDQNSVAEVPTSNEGEILYINADRTNSDIYDGLNTIAHEFVHLILHNQKVGRDGVFPTGAVSENPALDEGLAVLNEDLCGFTMSGGNGFLLSSVNGLLADGLNRSFFSFSGRASDYGSGYLFWKYVHDRFGTNVLRQMVTSSETGRANIETVSNLTFIQIYSDYVNAVALNPRAGLPANLSFQNLDLTGTFVSRSGQTFNLPGLSGLTGVPLPATFTSSEVLEPWGVVFYRAGGGDGSALDLRVSGASSTSARIIDVLAP